VIFKCFTVRHTRQIWVDKEEQLFIWSRDTQYVLPWAPGILNRMLTEFFLPRTEVWIVILSFHLSLLILYRSEKQKSLQFSEKSIDLQ